MTIDIQNFRPAKQRFTIPASTTSVNNAISQPASPATGSRALRVASNLSDMCFIEWGGGPQTATANSEPILPGEDIIFDMDGSANNFAVIMPTGTGNLYVSVGGGS